MKNDILIGQELARQVAGLLDETTVSLDIALYQLSPPTSRNHALFRQLWKALRAAASRGVTCRAIICEGGKILPGKMAALMTKQELESSGWQVKLVPDTKIMHAKMLILDNKAVIAGSHNWTEAGLLRNHEVSLCASDPQTASIATRWFSILWGALP